jgi:hypothetical protein
MFFSGSRYQNTGTYIITKADGTKIPVTKIPLPTNPALQGYHRRLEGQRLDLIAYRYFQEANGFWQLCDANDSIVPDALANRDLIGIPTPK